ncbi:hypothetical protein ARALYDRAFT_484800, partial [Arabidopsis lyrata subsp. lyrata]
FFFIIFKWDSLKSLVYIFRDTKVIAAEYRPKAGTKENENAEKACFEVYGNLKPDRLVIVNALTCSKGGLFCCLRKVEREYETILKRTLQSICVLTVVPNTTTSVIIQVVHDGGSVSFYVPYTLVNIY